MSHPMAFYGDAEQNLVRFYREMESMDTGWIVTFI